MFGKNVIQIYLVYNMGMAVDIRTVSCFSAI